MKSLIPAGAIWSGYGISRTQFHMVGQAVILGGHVRAGMEDKFYLRRGVLRRGNAARVERLAPSWRAWANPSSTRRRRRRSLEAPEQHSGPA